MYRYFVHYISLDDNLRKSAMVFADDKEEAIKAAYKAVSDIDHIVEVEEC